jgi:FSR family fosmidomycin resistance protein-like MFS transporter
MQPTPSHTAGRSSARRDAQVIGLVGVAHGTSHFFHLILAPLFPWLKQAFDLSYAQLGLLVSAFFVVSGIGQAIAGFVVDRIGAWIVLMAGVGLLAVAALGLAGSQSYAMLLLFSGVAGLGNSVFHPADFTILNRRVSVPRLGHAFSLHGIFGSLGWAAAPVFLAGLAALIGWRVALLAAAGLALAVLAALGMSRALLDTREAHGHPQQARGDGGEHVLSFLRLPGVWMCFAFFFITAMALGGIQSFAPSALVDLYGVPVALATTALTAYMLAQASGMLAGGFLAARTSYHERVIAGAFTVSGALCVLVASGAIAPATTVLMLALIGFGAGIAGPSRDLLVRAAAPRGATGRVYGVVYSGLDVGMSIAPLLFGAMMDSHNPGWVFIAIGGFQVMALFTAMGLGGTAYRARTQPA